MFSKAAFALILALILASGCRTTPGSASTTSTPVCADPGTTQMLEIDPETEIGLYLPPCYGTARGVSYPVLYLLPGAGGAPMDWFGAGTAAIAERSILGGEVPPFIIVATDDTYEDITLEAILDKVIPYIEGHTRADARRRWRAVAGGSLGGASAYTLAFEHPDAFASAGVFGNGIITGMDGQIREWLRVIPPGLKPRVFLNSGAGDTFMLQQAKLLIPLLDEAGIAHTDVFGPGGHDYATWTANFPAYFRWLSEDWR